MAIASCIKACVTWLLVLKIPLALSFFAGNTFRSSFVRTTPTTLQVAREKSIAGSNQWLQEYSIASGEIINPYEVLKVSRGASNQQVRESYITLSRRYHPVSWHCRNGIRIKSHMAVCDCRTLRGKEVSFLAVAATGTKCGMNGNA